VRRPDSLLQNVVRGDVGGRSVAALAGLRRLTLGQDPGRVQHAGAGFQHVVDLEGLAQHGVRHDQGVLGAEQPHARGHADGLAIECGFGRGVDAQRATQRGFREGA